MKNSKKKLLKFIYYLAALVLILGIVFLFLFFRWFNNEPSVGLTRGRYMGEWVYDNFHGKVLIASLKECYLGEKSFSEVVKFAEATGKKYFEGDMSSRQIRKETAEYIRAFLDSVKNKKTDCMQQNVISSKVKGLRDIEVGIAAKYYSSFNRWEIYLEKLKIWLYFHIYVDYVTPFDVPNI